MGYQNCLLRVQRHFLRKFFHRVILFDTVNEKIQLVLSKLHSIFAGNFWAKQLLFFSPCQIVQAWVTKTVFYVSRGIFAELFSQNHINWHCERKKSAGFVKTAFYFSGELLSKTILEVVDLVFSSPCQSFQAWVTKTFFYVSRGTFCGIFFTESY